MNKKKPLPFHTIYLSRFLTVFRCVVLPRIHATLPGLLPAKFSSVVARQRSKRAFRNPSNKRRSSGTHRASTSTTRQTASVPRSPCAELKYCFQPVSTTQLCWKEITCGSLSKHMRHKHGVSATHPEDFVFCEWNWDCGRCPRKNLCGHIQETHLGHKRGVGHTDSA